MNFFVEYFVRAIDVAFYLVGAIGRLIAKAQGENYEEPNQKFEDRMER